MHSLPKLAQSTDPSSAAGRAAHIAVVLPDFSSGGTERTASRLASAWVERGRQVTMLCGADAGPARALVAPRVTVLAPRPAIKGGPVYRLRLAHAFAKFVRAIDPDVVFGIGNFHVPVLAAMKIALGEQAPPLVCRLSNRLHRPELDPFTERAFWTVLRVASRRVDALVAMSEGLRDEARALLGRPDVVSIDEPNLPDGYAPAPRRTARPKTPLIVCAGRLERQKRFERALRAFAALPAGRDARLLVLGEGPQRAELEREAGRLGISAKVEFAGYVADIQPLFEQAQLLVCTSDYEGHPAVLVEAIAAGLAVVTTDCSPAVGEIMCDPSFGRITENDPGAIATAMEAVLDAGGPDPTARQRLIARHQLAPAADAYLELFDRVVAESRAPASRP